MRAVLTQGLSLDVLLEHEQRFWSLVDVQDQGSCWIWQGYVSDWGYGQISIRNKTIQASWIAWMLETQLTIPIGFEICHKCDVKKCCNPDHLFLGTRADNMKDMCVKGRHPGNGASGLVKEDVKKIRNLAAQGVFQREIGGMYGLAQNTISCIVNRRTWKKVL